MAVEKPSDIHPQDPNRRKTGEFVRGCAPGPGRPREPDRESWSETMNRLGLTERIEAVCARMVEAAEDGDKKARELLARYQFRQPTKPPVKVPEGWELESPLTVDGARAALSRVAELASMGADPQWVRQTKETLQAWLEVEVPMAELEELKKRALAD